MKNKAAVLVIDGGGRGSVLVDKYAQSQHVGRILAVPGNDLMGQLTKKPVKIFPRVKTTDTVQIQKICRQQKVDLVDVAQDDAVAAGLTKILTSAGFAVFGPTKAAGQIEWNKAWAREFMRKFDIPHPKFKICYSQSEGLTFIKSQKEGEWFIKASGLAAGKGSLYAVNNRQAIDRINQMENFGLAGQTYLIEQCLIGEEFSSFAIVDGKNFILVGHAQDHKRAFDGDLGPNTGGMGCSSPPMVITKGVEQQIKSIFKKTAAGLVKLKRPYRGILYLGGMIDKNGKVYVIEFNARWGDPEAQVIVPQIKNDFYDLAQKTISGNLKKIKIKKDNLYRVVVTAASRGYPDNYSSVVGKQIFGLGSLLRQPSHRMSSSRKRGSTIRIFGAGVKVSNKKYIAHGGRLFYVMAEGKNVADTRQIAYNALSKIKIEGNNLHYRTDIGSRDVYRLSRYKNLLICKSTRTIAAKALYQALKRLLKREQKISEVRLRDEWLEILRGNNKIFSDGWYDPPPYGIGVLFGTLKERERLNFPTLRDKQYWPQKDVFLNRQDGIITVYASPVDRKTGTIGDFGMTFYLGKDKDMQKHLRKVFQFNKRIFIHARVGSQLKDLYVYASRLFAKQGYTNSGWISINDPTKINMGHTIPVIDGRWKKDDISKRRIFLNSIETTEIQPSMAFTIEARLKAIRRPDLPTAYFHMIALFNENGKKELLTNFNEIFKLVGMDYMLKN